MSLGFILGTAAKDHQAKLVDQMAADMQQNPNDQFFYLVPNHIKFETEIQVLEALAHKTNQEVSGYTQSRLQVFSFSRLAWYLLKNTAAYQVPKISTTGLNMLVLSILKQHQGQLRLFAGEINQPGFINQITRQLEELRQANISADDLKNLASQVDENSDLNAKLQDLNVIYPLYEQQLIGRYIGNTDVYAQLAAYLNQHDLSQMHFYLDRFSSFTASEQAIVSALICHAQNVYVSVVLDQPYQQQMPDQNDLFFESGKLYHRLFQDATAHQVKLVVDQYAKQDRTSPELAVVDRFMIADTKMAQIQPQDLTTRANLQIFTTDNRLTELTQVARQIHQLVASGKYRYRDFLILTRHLDLYHAGLEPIFAQNNIPIFNDHEKQMDDHPLVELINALFEVQKHYYRYADMMRLLKTQLLLPEIDGQQMSLEDYKDALSVTENWLLKTGLHGDDWLREKDWQYYQFSQSDIGIQTDKVERETQKINLIRHFVKDNLPPFFAALEQATTGQQAATILYQFLVNQHVLETLAQTEDETGQQQQVWQTFCGLLDEYVNILGDQAFNVDDFQTILQTGFASATYSQIPSTMDQVTISETGIVQNNNRKVVFVIGATDAVMPDLPTESGLLTDPDKEQLTPQLADNQFLPSNRMEQLASDPFLNYLGFMSGQQRLIISAPRLDNNGNELDLSPYVTALQRYFDLSVTQYHQSPDVHDDKIAAYISAPQATISYLIQIGRQSKDQQTILPTNWRFVYQQLSAMANVNKRLTAAWQSLDYTNIPVPLKPEIVTGLYGNAINTSVSKLEEFYENEYAYFLKFGLKLKERDMFELSPANTGEFFHASLDQLVKQINASGKDMSEFSESELSQLIDQVVDQVASAPQFMILASSARMQYIGRQLTQTIHAMGTTLAKQSKYTKMRPMQTEVLFGQVQDQSGLQPLVFDLPGGRQVRVRGKIDRIDQLTTDKTHYLSVVDYKSGNKKFDITDAYYGIAMQMLTYLNAVKLNWQQLGGTPDGQLGGALYMHINNPKINLADLQKADNQLENVQLLANEYQGILLAQPDLLENLDSHLQTQSTSLLYPFKEGKTGYKKTSGGHLYTQENLALLMQRNLERIKNAATQIFSGADQLNPAKWNQTTTALQYSPFKDIFQFDAMLPENNYHQLKSLSEKDVFNLLKGDQDD